MYTTVSQSSAVKSVNVTLLHRKCYLKPMKLLLLTSIMHTYCILVFLPVKGCY